MSFTDKSCPLVADSSLGPCVEQFTLGDSATFVLRFQSGIGSAAVEANKLDQPRKVVIQCADEYGQIGAATVSAVWKK